MRYTPENELPWALHIAQEMPYPEPGMQAEGRENTGPAYSGMFYSRLGGVQVDHLPCRNISMQFKTTSHLLALPSPPVQ